MPHTIPKSALLASAFRRNHAGRKATILVAEDSADSREMMQVLLQTKGYDVISAVDGIRAVDEALKKLPDLVLLDLALPGLDGVEVTKELRLHHQLDVVPIIIVSGYDPERYQEAAVDAGCDDCLLKPIDFDRLDQILHEMVPSSFARACSA